MTHQLVSLTHDGAAAKCGAKVVIKSGRGVGEWGASFHRRIDCSACLALVPHPADCPCRQSCPPEHLPPTVADHLAAQAARLRSVPAP